MSQPHLKSQIHRDQLTWFLDLLLDEIEIFQLSVSTGIIPDVDRLYALPRRELIATRTRQMKTTTFTRRNQKHITENRPPKNWRADFLVRRQKRQSRASAIWMSPKSKRFLEHLISS